MRYLITHGRRSVRDVVCVNELVSFGPWNTNGAVGKVRQAPPSIQTIRRNIRKQKKKKYRSLYVFSNEIYYKSPFLIIIYDIPFPQYYPQCIRTTECCVTDTYV